MQRSSKPWRTLILCAALSVITLACYWKLLYCGFIGYDDPDYVTENAHIQSGLSWANLGWAFASGEACNWHPLTWISHMLDAQFFGLDPARHHLTNLLLHTASTVLLFLFLQGTTHATWRSGLTAALFAVHPLHVESVAWIAERKDVLSGFFFMLTLLAYARYARGAIVRRPESIAIGPDRTEHSSVEGPKSKATVQEAKSGNAAVPNPGFQSRRLSWYFLALFLFALGLMSKPMLVTVPLVLLLIDFWPLRRFGTALRPGGRATGSQARRCMVEKTPFLGLAMASSIITMRVQGQGGTVSSLQDFALTGRIGNAIDSYVTYLGKAIWPTNLAVFYPHPAISHIGQWPLWQTIAGAVALTLISVLAVLRHRGQPWLATGWFWYLITLIPVIGLVQVGSQAMADRYTYVPLIGIFVVVAWGMHAWLGARPMGRKIASTLALMMVSVCIVAAHIQVNLWADDFALFEHALKVNQQSAPAHAILGTAYGRSGNYGLALVHARAGVRADPSYAGAWHTLGDISSALGKWRAAVEDYRAALRLNPQMAHTWFRLGHTLATLRRPWDAIEAYRTALRLRPLFGAAHNNLGAVLWSVDRREEALKEFAEAARLDPKSPNACYNLGAAFADAGNIPEAETQLNRALRLKPDYVEALDALAATLVREGKLAQAQERYRELVRVSPINADARVRLGGSCLISINLTDDEPFEAL